MSTTNHIKKYEASKSVVGLIQDDEELVFRKKVEHLVDWCNTYHLVLNIKKKPKIVIDFGRKQPNQNPVHIDGTVVEIVESTKNLGVHISHHMTWYEHTWSLARRAQQRLPFLQCKKEKTYIFPFSPISTGGQ